MPEIQHIFSLYLKKMPLKDFIGHTEMIVVEQVAEASHAQCPLSTS